jgi:branched-chain amino acid transport system permease protein
MDAANNKLKIAIFALVLIPLPAVLSLSSELAYYIDVLVFVAIRGIIACGLCLLLGYAGQISLGHAAFSGVGAYTSAILTTKLAFSPWLAMPAGIVLAMALAYAIGKPALRLTGHYLAMATLGFGMIVFIVFNEFLALTGGPAGLGEIPHLSLAGIKFDDTISFYYLAWFAALGVLIISLNIVHSRVGRALRAIHGSEIAAQSLSVNTPSYKTRVFVLSAAFGALAGSLYAHFVTFVHPQSFDIFFSIKLLMMVVIGGIRNVWGAFIGAAVITFLPEFLTFLEDFDVLAYGVILLIIVMFMPEGLVSLGGRLKQLLAGKSRHG